mmetsp:Transcript_35253/g.79084  ORF Transcript_35253/g.79084 Transcript_35253/m.79084 type:complete len:213 (-) Transcript_35253:663-1301(-)
MWPLRFCSSPTISDSLAKDFFSSLHCSSSSLCLLRRRKGLMRASLSSSRNTARRGEGVNCVGLSVDSAADGGASRRLSTSGPSGGRVDVGGRLEKTEPLAPRFDVPAPRSNLMYITSHLDISAIMALPSSPFTVRMRSPPATGHTGLALFHSITAPPSSTFSTIVMEPIRPSSCSTCVVSRPKASPGLRCSRTVKIPGSSLEAGRISASFCQ